MVICAALAGGIVANQNYPVEFFNENIMIQNSLLNSALKLKLKRTIFLGTSCIYPHKARTPIKENLLLTGKLHETNEAYAIAKIAGIKLSEAMYRQHNLDIVCLMPTNVYGINDKYSEEKSHVIPGMIYKFLKAKKLKKKKIELWGDGSPRREFLHADDLGSACIFLLENYDDDIAINVGVGEDVSIKELAEMIKRIVGFEGTVEWDSSKPDGTPRKLLDVSRLTDLGWKAKISLEDGISSTYQWYKANQKG